MIVLLSLKFNEASLLRVQELWDHCQPVVSGPIEMCLNRSQKALPLYQDLIPFIPWTSLHTCSFWYTCFKEIYHFWSLSIHVGNEYKLIDMQSEAEMSNGRMPETQDTILEEIQVTKPHTVSFFQYPFPPGSYHLLLEGGFHLFVMTFACLEWKKYVPPLNPQNSASILWLHEKDGLPLTIPKIWYHSP